MEDSIGGTYRAGFIRLNLCRLVFRSALFSQGTSKKRDSTPKEDMAWILLVLVKVAGSHKWKDCKMKKKHLVILRWSHRSGNVFMDLCALPDVR